MPPSNTKQKSPGNTSRKILLPLLCAFLMPAISLLNNNVFSANVEPRRVIGSWIIGFFFLLLLWAIDQWIADRFNRGSRPSPAARTAAAAPTAAPTRAKRPSPTETPAKARRALRFTVQTLVNLILIIALISLLDLLDDLGINLRTTPLLAFVKLALASLIILSIQATLASLAEKEDILLANAELQNENLRTRFEVLKQQVNPHFLFNALGTLRIMIREKDDRAEPFILKLSDLYRQLLGKNTTQTVTLDEELEFLRSYIYMLQARFESLLHIDIDVWPDSMNRKIPAFSLQLLVENCIKHNIISSAKPLYIRISQDREDAIMIVNNLQTKPSADESSGIGLDNLRKRYELLQIRDGVTIQKTDTTFSVTLQLLHP
ncbi:MAG TPA: histidine kinase [Puia sp.]|nr:histidine kinase [Puia sp.]